jgi:hypothetical protein
MPPKKAKEKKPKTEVNEEVEPEHHPSWEVVRMIMKSAMKGNQCLAGSLMVLSWTTGFPEWAVGKATRPITRYCIT